MSSAELPQPTQSRAHSDMMQSEQLCKLHARQPLWHLQAQTVKSKRGVMQSRLLCKLHTVQHR